MVTTRIGYFNIKSAVFCRQSVLMCPAWFLQATAFVLRLLATCTLSIIWNSKNNMFNPAGYNRTISFQLVEDHFIYLPLNICTSGQVVSAEVSRKYAINVVGVPKIKKKKKPKQTEISTHKHQFRKGGGGLFCLQTISEIITLVFFFWGHPSFNLSNLILCYKHCHVFQTYVL